MVLKKEVFVEGYYRVNCKLKDPGNKTLLWILASLDSNGLLQLRNKDRELLSLFKCKWDFDGDRGYSCGEIAKVSGAITFIWRDPDESGEQRTEVGYHTDFGEVPIKSGMDFELYVDESEKFYFEVIEVVKLS